VVAERSRHTRRHVGLDYANGTWTASTTTQLNNRGFLDQEIISVGATSLLRSHGYAPEGYLSDAADASNSYGYGYDTNGLISRIDTGGVSTPLVRTGSTLQAGPVSYQFDSLGRVISAGDLSLSYGPDGQPSGATRNTGSWTFLNDETGARLAKLSAGAFVAAYLEEGVLQASGLTQPLSAGGTLIGVIANGSFQPIAVDTRGTVLADTNGTPRIASPYGDRAQHPDLAKVIDYVHLGYDADLGVVRMGVRDYDPRIHRFLTPDPLYLEEPVHCLDSPVDCNLYGYARNLPATYRDPDGKNPAILVGAAVGAGISTAAYMIFTPVEQWTLRGAGGAALGGAINGAIAGATGGASLLVQVGGGAIGSVAGGIVTRGIQTGSVEQAFDRSHVAVDLAAGVVLTGALSRLHASPGGASASATVATEEAAVGVQAARGGGAGVVRVGQAGEAAVRAAADIGEKVPIEIAGRVRIPDGITSTVLTEVKNVQSLSYTQQLRDFASYARENGLRFDLWVRPSTQLSGPLAEEVANGVINLRFIP